MTVLPSREPSRPELEQPSRNPSHPGANRPSSAIWPLSSPGLSSFQERRHIRILELNLQDNARSTGDAEPTTRDLAILQELDSHRYLDRNQIQALFFPGPRSCQYRLRSMLDQGLARAWRAATRPGRICRASVYLLSRRGAAVLAESRDEDPRPCLKRAEHALERNFHLIHQLEANQFFVGLAAATRESNDLGLYHWVGEHEIAASYAEGEERGPTPDGWGRLLTADGELLLHLEWDRGTEQPRRLRAKLLAYVNYFADRPHASANQVLLVAPTEARELQIRRLLQAAVDPDRDCCRFRTTTTELLGSAGPLEAIWSDHAHSGRLALASVAGLSRSPRRVEHCIGKPDWWLHRPGGGAGA